MRKNQDLMWLGIVIAVVANVGLWQARTQMQQADAASGLSRDQAFTLRIQGSGWLMVQSVEGGCHAAPRLVQADRFRVDPRDGDIVEASSFAHLLPRVTIPASARRFAIRPDGVVSADGCQRCGRIEVNLGPNQRFTYPDELGAGALVVER